MSVTVSDELQLETIPGGRWELLSQVRFQINNSDLRIDHTVAAGFECDLNSGHFLPESWHHRSRHAALLHDDLYRQGNVSRWEADRAFYYVLLGRGARKYRAKAMYLAVRASGWVSWNRHRKKDTFQDGLFK